MLVLLGHYLIQALQIRLSRPVNTIVTPFLKSQAVSLSVLKIGRLRQAKIRGSPLIKNCITGAMDESRYKIPTYYTT
jgi:hypothetical protein